MAEILDLRQFRPGQLESLLAAECEEWRRDLLWDYAGSLDLIRQYIGARILPGYVLADGTPQRPRPRGYGFFVYETHKGLIGDLFVGPSFRSGQRAEERRILEHMIETLTATPGLHRIEAQLMAFQPEELAPTFASQHFRAYRRLFLHLDLAAGQEAPPPRWPLRPWPGTTFESAATLIQESYARHVDSLINDQYRTFGGSLRFLQNVVHYPGCGVFDEAASAVADDVAGGALAGLVLVSRVRQDVAHVTQVCVAPRWRGRGLGRQLFDAVRSNLRQRGFAAITLTVTEANQGALKLYRQLGFTVLRQFDAYVWERGADGRG